MHIAVGNALDVASLRASCATWVTSVGTHELLTDSLTGVFTGANGLGDTWLTAPRSRVCTTHKSSTLPKINTATTPRHYTTWHNTHPMSTDIHTYTPRGDDADVSFARVHTTRRLLWGPPRRNRRATLPNARVHVRSKTTTSIRLTRMITTALPAQLECKLQTTSRHEGKQLSPVHRTMFLRLPVHHTRVFTKGLLAERHTYARTRLHARSLIHKTLNRTVAQLLRDPTDPTHPDGPALRTQLDLYRGLPRDTKQAGTQMPKDAKSRIIW